MVHDKVVWQYLKKPNVSLPYGLTMLLLDYPREVKPCIHTRTDTRLFLVVLFKRAKSWEKT